MLRELDRPALEERAPMESNLVTVPIGTKEEENNQPQKDEDDTARDQPPSMLPD